MSLYVLVLMLGITMPSKGGNQQDGQYSSSRGIEISKVISSPSSLGVGQWMLKKLLISSIASFQALVLSVLALEMLEIVLIVVPFLNTIVSSVGLLNRIVLTLAPKYLFGMPSLMEEKAQSYPSDNGFNRWITTAQCALVGILQLFLVLMGSNLTLFFLRMIVLIMMLALSFLRSVIRCLNLLRTIQQAMII